MADDIRKGDHVAWDAPEGSVQGTVKQMLTDETKIKGHTVKASKEHPEYLVKSDKSGADAAHTPEALHKEG